MDSLELRKKYVSSARRLVIKVGTNVLAPHGKLLDMARVGTLAEEIACLAAEGRQVALVSSGAIGAGMTELGMTRRPRTLPALQAAASVGQGKLMSAYEESFRKHGFHAGQILLTRDDLDERNRYLNASNTINTLFDMSCIPVINENDVVSTDELKFRGRSFGDNDFLAALVTHLVRAELLILLTSGVPGLLEGRPSGGRQATPMDIVEKVDDRVLSLAYEDSSPGGVGGMESKLEAVKMATDAGEAAVIADGTEDGVIGRLMAGEAVGTLFLPAPKRLSSYKRWIRFTQRPRGAVSVDDGARRAIERDGKSLLPKGVTAVEGEFEPGSLVRIRDSQGEEFARGLTNFSSAEIDRIKGLHTNMIERALGHKYYDEIIHRDNLTLIR